MNIIISAFYLSFLPLMVFGNWPEQEQTIQLFNGHNLDGWYTFLQDRGKDSDPLGVFIVKDGMIRISGEEWGCITTEKEYADYQLKLEFKWGEQTHVPRQKNARDSGLLLHSNGEDGGSQGLWMHSIECQIIEGGTGDFIVVGDGSEQYQISCNVASAKQGNSFVFQPEGHLETIYAGRINWFGRDPNWKDLLGFRGKDDVEKPAGEWNTLQCTASGNAITVTLNGVLVNHATLVKPSKGKIRFNPKEPKFLSDI